jgi:hypothetical protein
VFVKFVIQFNFILTNWSVSIELSVGIAKQYSNSPACRGQAKLLDKRKW